jgi:SAM-dependent methyltransferase
MSEDDKYVLNRVADTAALGKQNILYAPTFVAFLIAIVGRVESILNLGCGNNEIGVKAAQVLGQFVKNIRVVGCDNSPLALEVAKKTTERLGLTSHVEHLHYEAGEPLPLNLGGWGVVICSFLLEHVQDIPHFLNQVFWALRNKGSIVIRSAVNSDNLADSVNYPPYAVLIKLCRDIMALQNSKLDIGDELPVALTRAGFSDVETFLEAYLFGGTTEEGKFMIEVSRGRLLSLIDTAEAAGKSGFQWTNPYTNKTTVLSRGLFITFTDQVHDELLAHPEYEGVMNILITVAKKLPSEQQTG